MAGPEENQLTPEEVFGHQVAEIRGADSLRAFAARVGILSHAAIARLEKGDLHVVGPNKLKRFAKELGLDVPDTETTRRSERKAPRVAAFCSSPKCLDATIQIDSDGDCGVEPRRFLVSHRRLNQGEAHCDVCGSVLETSCPWCGKAYRPGGGKCSHCGLDYVPVPRDLQAWLIEQKPIRNEERAERESRSTIELDR